MTFPSLENNASNTRLADASPCLLLLLEPTSTHGLTNDFRLVEWNESARRLLKLTAEDTRLSQLPALGDPAKTIALAAEVLATGQPKESETQLSTDEGPRWYQQSWSSVNGRVSCSSWDITRLRASIDVHESSARFLDSIIENVPAMIFLKDARELRFVRINRAGEELLGQQRESLIGRGDFDFFPSEQARFFQERDQETLRRGELVVVPEEPIQTGRGLRWLHTMKIPVRDGAGVPTHLLGISHDITDKRRQEAELRQHSIILATMSEGVCLVRDDLLTICYTNPKFDRMLGYEPGELLGQPVTIVNHESETTSAVQVRDGIVATLKAKGEASYEVRNRRKDGSSLWCRVNASGFESPDLGRVWIAIHEDVTERHELQSKLALEDRMTSLGRLAAGVAHEVNNPLTYVKTNLEIMAEELKGAFATDSLNRLRDLPRMVEDVQEGVDRIRQIVRSLRSFSRADQEQRYPLDVRVVLDLALKMVGHEIQPRAKVVKEYLDVLPVTADEVRLGQVFVNILANAAASIEEGTADKNEIRVRTRTEGPRVVIEIEDTGAGISQADQARIFDPFFTTKPVGQGSGLGLSICHGIIKSLAGTIEVASTVGKGSTFKVTLLADEAQRRPVRLSPAPSGDSVEVKRRRILVIDDEVQILRAIRLVLSKHDVVTLWDAQQAIDLLRRGDEFDLILCDLMMPVITGMELHAILKRERPPIADRIVFMTGGAFTGSGRAFLDRVPNQRLDKPFDHGTLRALVANLPD